MTLLLAILAGVLLAGIVVTLWAAWTAPLGYEDERGFNYGEPHR